MQNIFRHWKTSSTGLIMIASGISLFVNNRTMVTEALTAILGGIGLLFAADNTKQ